MEREEKTSEPRESRLSSMTIRADLHSHTTTSDGTLTPTDLVRHAAKRGITHLGLTDHDTCGGVDEAQAAAGDVGIEILPGVEVTCAFKGSTIHMLGIGVDPQDTDLLRFNRETQDARRGRYLEMMDLLRVKCGLGELIDQIDLPPNDETLARPKLARALVEVGAASSVVEVFERWLGNDGPAYVEHKSRDACEAMGVIHAAGGISSLAHCGNYRNGVRRARELLDQGMDAVEVYHPDHDEHTRKRLLDIVEYRKKLVTGGSDFHGFDHRKAQHFGRIHLGERDFYALCQRIAERQSKRVAA